MLVGRRFTDALLVAAREGRISMFGDVGVGRSENYFSRAVASLRQHTFTEVGADFDPVIDRSGKRIVFASTRHNRQPDLYIKQVDGVAVTQLTSDPASDLQPALSADGTRLAFASNRGGTWDIWVMDLEGGAPMQVTSGGGDEIHPSWSPDGLRLVYCLLPAHGGQWEIWMSDASHGGNATFIGYGLFPEWSPAGDTIVFQRARERGRRNFGIWTIKLVNGQPFYPTELVSSADEAMTLPAWSTDGRSIAFVRSPVVSPAARSAGVEAYPSDLWIMQADGRGATRLTDGHSLNQSPAFSPDGMIYFSSRRTGYENIWSLAPARGIAQSVEPPFFPDGGRDTAVTPRIGGSQPSQLADRN